MSVVNLLVGGVTSISARVNAKASPTATSVELLVSTSPDVSSPTTFGPVTPDLEDMVAFTATGLTPGTRYYYALDEDSTFDPEVDPIGTFLTHPTPGTPTSFAFAVGGCSGAGPPAFPGDGTELDPAHVSNHPVLAEIRNRALDGDWAFFMHTGDLHYYDIGTAQTASLANYRRAIDDVLHQSNMQTLVRDVPFVYAWDDHDFDGNNSNGTYADKLMPQQVYRERVPSYPLPNDGTDEFNNPIYHSFEIGRVLFIVSDSRSSRSPDGDPDGPAKTLLGQNQKTWMQGVLLASDAEFCVWMAQELWLASGGVWQTYATERAELVDMFTQTGFVDKMMVVTGDSHFMAIDDGTNTPGGMPMFCANHLDSNPGSSGFPFSEGPVSNSKGQYGTVTVTDDGGDVIDVTLQGWRFGEILIKSLAFTVGDEPEPPDPPGPDPEGLPGGIINPVVIWLGCDLVTGRIIADLPDMTGGISRLLGAHTSASLQLPTPLSGPGKLGDLAFQATTPGRTMVVAVVNDQPAWAGLVLTRRGGTGATLELACATLESYLTRRRVSDQTYSQVDEATIAAGLLGDAATILGIGSGIGLEIDAPPTGTLRDRDYKSTDRATVYDRLRELSGVQAGPEWTIELLWGDDTQTYVRKISRVRKRIGIASDTPEAIFETTAASVFSSAGSSEARYTYTEDYSGNRGANYVVAYSTGEGDDQPASFPEIDTDLLAAGWPIYEHHWQPSSSITSATVLDQHAASELALRRNGARTWEIEARWNVYPRMNVDWRLGDDVAWQLIGHRHPEGVTGQGRCIGWDLDPQGGTVRPILLDPSSDEGA